MSPTTGAAIRAAGLRKRFGAHAALDGLDLEVARGDLFGFLGQNGAGKTTAIRVLARLLRPDAGEAFLLGRDLRREPPARALQGTGFLVETPAFPPYLRGEEALLAQAALLRLKGARAECARQLERFGLAGAARARVGGYSLGMRQRLGLAAAFLGQPELLVLDEPTNGLDPGGIARFRELLREEWARGATVLLSSHLLAEVEATCNKVAIVAAGRTVAHGAVADLLRGGDVLHLRVADATRAGLLLREAGLAAIADDGRGLLLRGDDAAAARALRMLAAAGLDVYEATRARRSLEEVYRDLTEPGA